MFVYQGNIANVINTIQANKVADDTSHSVQTLSQGAQSLVIR